MCEQLWKEFNDRCHVATFVCMSARFSHDEEYFYLHKIRYLNAVGKANFVRSFLLANRSVLGPWVTRLGSPASPRMVPVDAAACRAYRDPGARTTPKS